MINSIRAVQNKDINNLDENLLIPLIKYFASNENNLLSLEKFNRNIFYVDRKILKIDFINEIKNDFCKINKSKLNNDKKIELILSYANKNYGERDLKELKNILLEKMKDINWLVKFAYDNGLNDKERKIIGV